MPGHAWLTAASDAWMRACRVEYTEEDPKPKVRHVARKVACAAGCQLQSVPLILSGFPLVR